MKVLKCPYCGATESRDGGPFYGRYAESLLRLHIIVEHPNKTPTNIEPEIVDIKLTKK